MGYVISESIIMMANFQLNSKFHDVDGVEHIATALQRPPLTLPCRFSYSLVHAVDDDAIRLIT